MASTGKKAHGPASAVLILGSGFGALKVAEDLSLAGIPVAWATRAANFLELPQGVQPFPEWPEDLSFQFRPLYLRVTRNPLVTLLPQAHLEDLRATSQGYRALVEQDPRYIDYDLCTGCDRCREACPLSQSEHPPLSRSPAYCPSRALQLDKRPLSPCRLACPLGVNAQAYLALTAAGRYDEALAVIRRDNPLPGVCGRVCHHPCEAACRRGELDKPLAIRGIKRFLFDHESRQGLPRSAGSAPGGERPPRGGGGLGPGRAHGGPLPAPVGAEGHGAGGPGPDRRHAARRHQRLPPAAPGAGRRDRGFTPKRHRDQDLGPGHFPA